MQYKFKNIDIYGWQEYITSCSIEKMDEAQEFYQDLGMHLGFIYMFQGSDFHYENIISHGPKPVLIDLETLFQPNLNFSGETEQLQLLDYLNQTVYKSFFLNHISYPEESKSLNLYAINKKGNKLRVQRTVSVQWSCSVAFDILKPKWSNGSGASRLWNL